MNKQFLKQTLITFGLFFIFQFFSRPDPRELADPAYIIGYLIGQFIFAAFCVSLYFFVKGKTSKSNP
jgi:hypothetical protein